MQNQSKRETTFDTQLKTALTYPEPIISQTRNQIGYADCPGTAHKENYEETLGIKYVSSLIFFNSLKKSL